jgi:hypothetical protein
MTSQAFIDFWKEEFISQLFVIVTKNLSQFKAGKIYFGLKL